MKYRILIFLIGLTTLVNCNQDTNSTFKGVYSFIGNSCMFISCDGGVVMNIRPVGPVYEKMKDRYIAFEMNEKPVLVTLKAKIVERFKLKNDREIMDIEATSFLEMEVGKTCAGKTINH